MRTYKQSNPIKMEVRQTQIFALNDKLTRAMQVILIGIIFCLVLMITLTYAQSAIAVKTVAILMIGAGVSIIFAMVGYIRTSRELASLEKRDNTPKMRVSKTYDPREDPRDQPEDPSYE